MLETGEEILKQNQQNHSCSYYFYCGCCPLVWSANKTNLKQNEIRAITEGPHYYYIT